MRVEESFVGKLQIQYRKITKVERRKTKKQKKILQIFCLCNPTLQNEVCHFLLLFIILFLLRDLLQYPSLRKLLKQLEKTRKITRKL
jgi:hypothetical protein